MNARILHPLIATATGELEVDWVCSDNRKGMRQAVIHLLSLGYRDLVLLNGLIGISVTRERLSGYHFSAPIRRSQ